MKFLSVILVSILLISCQKENRSSTQHISKIKTLIFSGSNNSKIDFTYDNLGRVQEIFIYFGNSPANVPPADSIYLLRFSYIGSNQLPSICHIRRNLGYPAWNQYSHYLFYDTNLRPSADSILYSSDNILSPTFLEKRTFIYGVNYINALKTIGFERMLDSLVVDSFNFTKRIRFVNGNVFIDSYEYEYDNKINPLNHLNISPIYFAISDKNDPSMSFWSIWTLCNRHNITAINSSNSPNSFILTYEYNANGIPVKRYSHYTWNYPVVEDTMTYIYQ
jgi:hypothetical protein